MIHKVEIQDILHVWRDVKQYIKDALEQANGEYNVEDVLTELINGEAHLHVYTKENEIKGAFVTKIIEYPRKRSISIWLVGGEDFSKWVHDLEQWTKIGAERVRADFIEWYGRIGWQRYFKNSDKWKMSVHGCWDI